VVYTSATLSLAALEVLVHLDRRDAPDDLVAVAAEIPDEVTRRTIEVSELPSTWRRYPAPPALADLGTAWAQAGRITVLVVPSALVPAEANYLLNPAHEAFPAIRVLPPEPFRFDPRLRRR
jgi:RES domain-containing protein